MEEKGTSQQKKDPLVPLKVLDGEIRMKKVSSLFKRILEERGELEPEPDDATEWTALDPKGKGPNPQELA
ncbi:MAG: hypothetical protein V1800_07765 [Candidatus Latescibacterota bacterium]